MTSNRCLPLAMGLATGAALAAAPLFVQPGTWARPGLRKGHIGSDQGSHARDASTSPASGLGMLAAGAILGFAAAKPKAKASPRGPAVGQHAARKAPVLEEDDDELEEVPRPVPKAKAAPRRPVFKPSEEIGTIGPLGFFDPLGFCPEGKRNIFRNQREMEIKHGRVAMLATVGLVAQHFIHRSDVSALKIYLGSNSPNGIGALGIFYGPEGFLQLCGISFFILVMEFFIWAPDDYREPGDYGNPLNIPFYTPEMRYNELTNGRFAMISVVGILLAELVTGKDAVQQLGF